MLLLLASTTSIALAGDEVYAASVSVLLPCLRGEEGRRELKEEEERCGGVLALPCLGLVLPFLVLWMHCVCWRWVL
jgi:hypothetical protein